MNPYFQARRPPPTQPATEYGYAHMQPMQVPLPNAQTAGGFPAMPTFNPQMAGGLPPSPMPPLHVQTGGGYAPRPTLVPQMAGGLPPMQRRFAFDPEQMQNKRRSMFPWSLIP